MVSKWKNSIPGQNVPGEVREHRPRQEGDICVPCVKETGRLHHLVQTRLLGTGVGPHLSPH